jgi:hypothetical protein
MVLRGPHPKAFPQLHANQVESLRGESAWTSTGRTGLSQANERERLGELCPQDDGGVALTRADSAMEVGCQALHARLRHSLTCGASAGAVGGPNVSLVDVV